MRGLGCSYSIQFHSEARARSVRRGGHGRKNTEVKSETHYIKSKIRSVKGTILLAVDRGERLAVESISVLV